MSRAYKNRKKALAKLDRVQINEYKDTIRRVRAGEMSASLAFPPETFGPELDRARWEVDNES